MIRRHRVKRIAFRGAPPEAASGGFGSAEFLDVGGLVIQKSHTDWPTRQVQSFREASFQFLPGAHWLFLLYGIVERVYRP